MVCLFRSGCGVVALLVALAGCTELIEDSGRACVVPREVACDCAEGEPCGPELAILNSESGLCEGLYPPDTELQLDVYMRGQSWAPSSDAQCAIEIVDRQIVVRASYRESTVRHTSDNWVFETCAVPPLDLGTWTLVYGGEEADFVVGEPAPQTMACVGNSWDSGS